MTKSKNDQLAACEGKQGYKSWHMATSLVAKSNKTAKQQLQMYKCSYCNLFHIGHNSSK